MCIANDIACIVVIIEVQWILETASFIIRVDFKLCWRRCHFTV